MDYDTDRINGVIFTMSLKAILLDVFSYKDRLKTFSALFPQIRQARIVTGEIPVVRSVYRESVPLPS